MQKQNKKQNGKLMDGNKLRTELAKLMPNYSIDEDNDGQIVIYTNLTEDNNGNYEEMGE